MPIITLITDLGQSDWYLGALKGAILKEIPEARIVDLCHDVGDYDIQRAGFILKQAFPSFPANTIHIISVNAAIETDKLYVAVKHAGQYFIGTDNGIFTLAFGDSPTEYISDLSAVAPDPLVSSFQAKDIFLKGASLLASGNPIQMLGREKSGLFEMINFNPWVGDNIIKGSVIYNDKFGNAITNIHKSMFEETLAGRKFEITFWKAQYSVKKIVRSYTSVEPGGSLAIFNSSGLLEISVNQGSAKNLLGLRLNETVNIHIL